MFRCSSFLNSRIRHNLVTRLACSPVYQVDDCHELQLDRHTSTPIPAIVVLTKLGMTR